ncbi:MAG TPA: hemolysin family protein [Spirochaetota bacterium]|nr:hemolysin family protein [Spirochaetota bacterium]HPI88821.1 hemolysin family protein [Spirochaetota bacterium]HPR47691.1 hemolysin family protein [Spirochaetota bacterium]
MESLLKITNLYYEITIAVLIVLSAFFSGTETAIVSASRLRIESLSGKGNKRAARSLKILDRIEDAIGLVLISNNIVNVMATAFITYIATRAFLYDEYALFLVTALQTIFFLIFCEVLPKVYARARAENYLMFFSGLIQSLMIVTKPVIRSSLAFSTLLKSFMHIQDQGGSLAMSRDEIETLFKLGSKDGIIEESNRLYVSEILSFSKITAQEIITPTIDIVSIEAGSPIKELVEMISTTKYSRIPVYEKRVDNIVGFVYYRDLVLKKNIKTISDILKEAAYVPATKKINDLYREMQKQNLPLVFVVSEFGAVIGMVTHEDIVEEVVGEIQTRDHFNESLIIRVSEWKYLLDPNLAVDFFNRLFNAGIPKKGYETLAGFLQYQTGKVPKKGDRIQYERFTFTIEEATPRSIDKIMLSVSRN